MANELSSQQVIQQQINEILVARTGVLNSHTKILTSQLDLHIKMRNVLRGEGIKEAEAAVTDLNAALEEGAKKAEENAAANQKAGEALKATAEKAKQQRQAMANLSAGIDILGKSFTNAIKTSMAFGSSIFNVIESVGKLALAVISVPFKMFDALAETAETLPRTTALADALEDVRDAFGDIEQGGKAVAGQLGTIRAQASNLAGTGLNLVRTFGFGAEGLAGALKAVTELAQGTGEAFTRLKSTFKKSGLQLAMMQKGLGASAESMGQLMNLAELRGKDVAKTLVKFSKITLQTAKAFKVDVKGMAHGMIELNADVSTFGHLGPKAFAPMVVFAKKLGIEVKDLAGTMKKFSGFSDTAKAASELAQGFGMNVDAMKLMSAQNPAEKIDVLRKSFFAAGKDLSKMSYQQRQYLEQTTGLQGASLEAAFALDKQGLSYENIEKQSKAAGKGKMSEKQVMKEMGKNIKQLNILLERDKVTGFFDAFVKGFGVGLLKAKDMRDVLHKLRTSFDIIFKMGRKVGMMFVKEFPGAKEMLKVFQDLLDPTRVKKFADAGLKAFKKLFKGGSVSEFFEDIQETFDNTFGGGGATAKLKKGFDKFTEALGKMLGQAFGALTKIAVQHITKMIDFIAHPEKLKGAMNAAEGFAGNLLGPIADAIVENAPALGDALKELLWKVFERVRPVLEKIGMALATVFALKFGVSLAAALVGAAVKTAATEGLKALMAKMSAGVQAPPGGADGGAADYTGLAQGMKSMIEVFRDIKTGDVYKAGGIILALAAVIGGSMIILALAFKAVYAIMSPAEFLVAATTMVPMALALVAAAGAIWMIQKMPEIDVKQTTKGLLAIAVTMPLMAAAILAAAAIINQIDLDPAAAASFGVLTAILFPAAMIAIGAAALIGYFLAGPQLAAAAGGLAALMLTMPAIGLAIGLSAWVINKTMTDLTEAQVLQFGALTAILFPAALVAIGAAALIGLSIAGPQVLAVVLGMAAFLVIMPLIGVAIGISAAIINQIPILSPAAITSFGSMTATLFTAAGVAITAAVGIGLLMMTGIGAVAIVVGLLMAQKVMTSIADVMTDVITKFAAIPVSNPEAFKTKMEAIAAVLGSMGGFVVSFSTLLKTVTPGVFQTIFGSNMDENIEATTKLIDSMMQSGLNPLIEKIIKLASSKNISKEAVKAVHAISGILNAIAGIMKTFSPSDAAFKAAEEAEGYFTPGAGTKILNRAAMHATAMSGALDKAFVGVGKIFKEVEKFAGKDFSKVAPVVSAIGGVLSAVAGIMKAFSPSEGGMKAAAEATKSWGASAPKIIAQINERIPMMKDALLGAKGAKEGGLIGAIKDGIIEIMKALEPTLKQLMTYDINPQVLKAGAKIISIVLGTLSTFMSTVSKAFNAIIKASTDKDGKFDKGIMQSMVARFIELGTSLGGLMAGVVKTIAPTITSIIAVAKTIPTKNLGSLIKKIDVIGKMIEFVTDLSGVFGGTTGPMADFVAKGQPVDKNGKAMSGLQVTALNIDRVLKRLFDTGLVQKLVNAVGGLKIDKNVGTKQVKNLKNMMSIVDTTINILSAAGGADIDTNKAEASLLKVLGLFAPPGTGLVSKITGDKGGVLYQMATAITPDLGKKMRKAPFTKVAAELKNVDTMLTATDDLVKTLDKMQKINGEFGVVSLAGAMSYLADAATSIVTANKSLDPKNIGNVVPILDALKGFKGGEIKVSHNLPNTKIEVAVHIDAKELGSRLIAVDLGAHTGVADAYAPSAYAKTYIDTSKNMTKMKPS
jgi:hypothetical protein